MTEAKAKEACYELKIGKFPFSASGKASAAGAKDGFVKLIFDAVSDLDLNWITCRPFPMGCRSSSCHKLYAEIAVSARPLWFRSS